MPNLTVNHIMPFIHVYNSHKEQAYLKVLMDEIFGNYQATITVKMSHLSGVNRSVTKTRLSFHDTADVVMSDLRGIDSLTRASRRINDDLILIVYPRPVTSVKTHPAPVRSGGSHSSTITISNKFEYSTNYILIS